MKTSKLLALFATFTAAAFFAVAADAPAPSTYSVTITNAHMCCQKCVDGAAAAVKSLPNVTAIGDTKASTIVVTAPDKATAQKAVDALTGAGFFGKSSSSDITVNASTGAKADKVASMEISNLHLCCGKCVTAVGNLLYKVPGYQSTDAKQGAKSFTVTGDISPKDVMDALQKGGLTGQVTKTTAAAAAPAKS